MKKGKAAVKAKIKELEAKGFDRSNKEDSVLSSLMMANEMIERGFHFENISLMESDATMFKVNKDGTGLIPPFISIDGLGDVAAKKIVEERSKGAFVSIEDFQVRGKLSDAIIDKFRGLGAFENMPESSQLSLDLFL